jgi:hypothetical protein
MPWTRAKLDKYERQPQPIRLRLVIHALDTNVDSQSVMQKYWETKRQLEHELQFELDLYRCSAPSWAIADCQDDIFQYEVELKKLEKLIQPAKEQTIDFVLDPSSTWKECTRLLQKYHVRNCRWPGAEWWMEAPRDDELLANVFGYSRPYWRQRRVVLNGIC